MAAFTNSGAYHEDKYGSYDTSPLDQLVQQDTPSQPTGGAASQGALETPPSGGEASPAFNEGGEGEARKPALTGEGPQDMLSIFQNSSEEEKDALTKGQTEAMAPHGKSLEGGVMDIFKAGGPQAMARAAQFGVDLTPFANKMNPGSGEVAVGQAMGNVPSDENAGKPAFKTKEKATADQRGREQTHQAAKKKAQTDAMAAFLMETGLRILASDRPDAASAFGEAALGTMESGRARKRQGAQDKRDSEDRTIAQNDRERRQKREDSADEAAKVEAAAKKEERDYQKTQRGAAEDKVARSGMQEVINKDGDVYFFDPLNPGDGQYVTDKDGNRVKSADAGLSPAQVATNARAYTANRLKTLTSIEKDIKEYDTLYPEIRDETDPEKKKALIDAAVDERMSRFTYDESGNTIESYEDY
jgi:hypothetical protein